MGCNCKVVNNERELLNVMIDEIYGSTFFTRLKFLLIFLFKKLSYKWKKVIE